MTFKEELSLLLANADLKKQPYGVKADRIIDLIKRSWKEDDDEDGIMLERVVYFEMFGRKMKTTVIAASDNAAVKEVKDKLIVHKIVPDPNSDLNKAVKDMADFLNIKL